MNYNRFINVARWNFAINRAQYMKLALSLFLVMSMPLLHFILKTIWVSAISGSTELALASIPGTSLGTWMCGSFLFALPILAGYTFHNLLNKQDRIKELTLPASNGEKFLFHALVTIGGALLTYVVSFFLLDVIQYLFVGIVYGFSYAEWVPYVSVFFNDGGLDISDHFFTCSPWFLIIINMSFIAFISTFVLGNAIKYKHNVLWTILFHWLAWFLLIFLLGLSLPLLKDVDWEWLRDWLQNMGPDKTLLVLKWVTLLVLTALVVFFWWMSYRLYCRAQITTKRNK